MTSQLSNSFVKEALQRLQEPKLGATVYVLTTNR
jgi:hypothetical protein